MSEGFAQRLSKARAERKLSVNEVSKRSGILKNSIYLYESGKAEPRLSFALALAKVLDVSLDYLAKG